MSVHITLPATQTGNRVAKAREELRRHCALGLLVLLCLTLFPPQLGAGPPFLKDDPQTVDSQHWEFYLASTDFPVLRRISIHFRQQPFLPVQALTQVGRLRRTDEDADEEDEDAAHDDLEGG